MLVLWSENWLFFEIVKLAYYWNGKEQVVHSSVKLALLIIKHQNK